MKKLVFSVRDQKAELFMDPFVCVAPGVATRSFTAAVNQAGHDFNRFPEDYSLWRLGEYDDVTGELVAAQPPVHVVAAINCVKEGV